VDPPVGVTVEGDPGAEVTGGGDDKHLALTVHLLNGDDRFVVEAVCKAVLALGESGTRRTFSELRDPRDVDKIEISRAHGCADGCHIPY
jgi:hypothetical protein